MRIKFKKNEEVRLDRHLVIAMPPLRLQWSWILIPIQIATGI